MPPPPLYFLFEGFARVEAAEEEDEEWVAETGDSLPRDSLPITETSPLSRAFLPPSLPSKESLPNLSPSLTSQ